jgi:ribonuclease H2 subunit A
LNLLRADYLDSKVFVDPVGPHEAYEAKLKAIFPTLQFTVVPKADALFPVVSAASIVAKVTRDVFMEVWKFDEVEGQLQFSSEFGSGYPSGEHLDPDRSRRID